MAQQSSTSAAQEELAQGDPKPQVQETTRNCLNAIRSQTGTHPAMIVILFGKTGAGKSSLVEQITGVAGLSGDTLDPVTSTCEIAKTSINGREYFFIDTPGFDDDDGAWDVFLKIMDCIDVIRENTIFVGVWYVIDNRLPRFTKFEAKLHDWLAAFCGEQFFPYITFVTTHWGCADSRELDEYNKRLANRKERWKQFLDKGAKTYQHGKLYHNGEETDQTLSWHNSKEELCAQARQMVSRRCQHLPSVRPQIIQELNEDIRTRENTAAAKVFRLRPASSAARDRLAEQSVHGELLTMDNFHERPKAKNFPERTKRKDITDWTPEAKKYPERTGRMENTDRKSEPNGVDTTDWESSYRYDILSHKSSQIRLLTLFPAKDKSANIHCSLETASLPSKDREYEALSYTWGDQSNKHRLFIGKDTLNISQNLFDVLCHLRHPLKPRHLWVDAVCINQASDEEKTHQVRQMHDIYFNASKVLVWLGKSDEDIDQAMEFLQDSRENRDQREKPLVGLRKMFSRSWWSRLWVVQEVVAARTEPLVICGGKSAPWEAVNTTLLQISWDQLGTDKKDRFLSDPETLLHFTLLRTETDRRNTKSKTTLESLLMSSCNREASEPRDHVYALLGLVSDPGHEPFELDYTKSEVLVYQDAMISVFKSRQDLDWLVYAVGGGESVKLSWCVDFSTKAWAHGATDQGWRPTARENRKQRAAEAGATAGKELLEIFHDPGSGTIKLAGTEIGHIDGVHMSTCGGLRVKREAGGSVNSEEISSALESGVTELFYDIGAFIIYAHPALKKRLGSDEAAKKLAAGDAWKVAAGGISFDKLMSRHKTLESPPNGYALLEKFVQKTNMLRQVMSHEWADLLPEEPASFEKTAFGAYVQIAFHAGDRCFFTTNTGYIGRAGHLVQKGDVLCILFGCKLPAVLRPQEDGSYKLVTFTYTHDVMEGEFLRDSGFVEEKEFLLR